MAAYYVFGVVLVVWALALSALGLTRAGFPPSGAAGRTLVGATVLIVVGTLAALLLTTHKEHPREEAAAKAAEHKAAGKTTPGAAGAAAPAKTVEVKEKEFSIALSGSKQLKAGSYTFQVANVGKVQHDLAIEGNGLKEVKTPLVDPGQSKALKVDLKAGKYKFFCAVPGHEQLGMKVSVTVTGGKAKPAGAPAAKKQKAAKRPKGGGAQTAKVSEKEFSIALPGGKSLKAGSYTFDVANDGKVQHDLAIEGNGLKETKTPLIDPGRRKTLKVALKTGKYKFFCSVPGHEQAGMKVDVAVR
jgi:uncharacterized cupredoxin-like copper-binding protein